MYGLEAWSLGFWSDPGPRFSPGTVFETGSASGDGHGKNRLLTAFDVSVSSQEFRPSVGELVL